MKNMDIKMTDAIEGFTAGNWPFKMGDRVRKKRGSRWRGYVVGAYVNEPHTQRGYAIASAFESGNVQVYPEAALELAAGDWQALGDV